VLKLVDGIVELYKKVATSLPPDIENALIAAAAAESPGSNAGNSLQIILENIKMARNSLSPICQDTGIPIFFIRIPSGISQREVTDAIIEGTRKATQIIPLRPNAVDSLTGTNSGDNTGVGFPVIYFEETEKSTLFIDLILKGSGCENVGQTYKLPDETLNAQRDLDGVRKCIVDTVQKAQGRACPPYTIGVGLGGSKDQVAVLAKKQLLRKLTDSHPVPQIKDLELRTVVDANSLMIGPLGFGGKTSVLGVKVNACHRHPASFFVDVTVSCWANRRGTLLW